MKNKMSFGKAFTNVISFPVYAVFAVILIIYCCLGNVVESLLILFTMLFSALVRTVFLLKNPGLEDKTKKSKDKTIFKSFRSLSLKLSVGFALSAVPLMIFRLISPSSLGFSDSLSQILTAVSLGLSVFCGAPGSILEYACSIHLKNADSAGFSINDITSAEKIAECDKALILNPSLLFDRTNEVRAVWFGGAVFRGMSLSECSSKAPAELCLLCGAMSRAYIDREETVIAERENALFNFGEAGVSDQNALSYGGCSFDAQFDYPSNSDFSVFLYSNNGSDSTVVRSIRRALVNDCGYFRTPDGAYREFGDYELDNLHDAIDKMNTEGLLPFFFIRFGGIGVPSRHSRTGILEAVVGVGGTFPYFNREAAEPLSDFGVSTLLVLPGETKSAVDFAECSGLCNNDDRIFRYSEYNDELIRNDKNLSSVRAMLGFPREELNSILRSCAQSTSGICSVLRKSDDLPVMSFSKASVSVPDRSDSETEKVADVTINEANERKSCSGISALFSLFTGCVVSMCRLNIINNILMTYGIMLVFCFAIPFFCGASSLVPSSFAVTLCGMIVCLFSVLFTSYDKIMIQNRSCFDYDKANRKRYMIESGGLGLIIAVAICVTGLVAFKDDYASSKNYMLSAMMMSGTALCVSLRLNERKRYAVSNLNFVALIFVLLSLLFCFANSYIRYSPLFGNSLSAAAVPFKNFLVSLIPSVVPFLYTAVSVAFKRLTEREAETQL